MIISRRNLSLNKVQDMASVSLSPKVGRRTSFLHKMNVITRPSGDRDPMHVGARLCILVPSSDARTCFKLNVSLTFNLLSNFFFLEHFALELDAATPCCDVIGFRIVWGVNMLVDCEVAIGAFARCWESLVLLLLLIESLRAFSSCELWMLEFQHADVQVFDKGINNISLTDNLETQWS